MFPRSRIGSGPSVQKRRSFVRSSAAVSLDSTGTKAELTPPIRRGDIVTSGLFTSNNLVWGGNETVCSYPDDPIENTELEVCGNVEVQEHLSAAKILPAG